MKISFIFLRVKAHTLFWLAALGARIHRPISALSTRQPRNMASLRFITLILSWTGTPFRLQTAIINLPINMLIWSTSI